MFPNRTSLQIFLFLEDSIKGSLSQTLPLYQWKLKGYSMWRWWPSNNDCPKSEWNLPEKEVLIEIFSKEPLFCSEHNNNCCLSTHSFINPPPLTLYHNIIPHRNQIQLRSCETYYSHRDGGSLRIKLWLFWATVCGCTWMFPFIIIVFIRFG